MTYIHHTSTAHTQLSDQGGAKGEGKRRIISGLSPDKIPQSRGEIGEIPPRPKEGAPGIGHL